MDRCREVALKISFGEGQSINVAVAVDFAEMSSLLLTRVIDMTHLQRL
jgi:hypothetical protein